MAYWMKFKKSAPGCVEAENEEAATKIATELRPEDEVVSCKVIPYPADPRLNKVSGEYGVCPSFCFSPEKCSGHTCCPKNYSCTE